MPLILVAATYSLTSGVRAKAKWTPPGVEAMTLFCC